MWFFVLFVFIFSLVCGGVQHILCCHFLFCLSSSFVFCVLVSNACCVVICLFVCLYLFSCVWWGTTPCTRPKTKTSKIKHTTQYVLDTTMHKTKDEDKQNKTHNTICVGRPHAQDQRRRQAK
jgi:hypothetical protein